MTSGGRAQTGASALRRYLSVVNDRMDSRVDSSNDLISASRACLGYSRGFVLLGSIVKRNGVAVCIGFSALRHRVTSSCLRLGSNVR